MGLPDWMVPLWDAINAYTIACGGDPSKHVYGNTPRMNAVAEVDEVVRNAIDEERASCWNIVDGARRDLGEYDSDCGDAARYELKHVRDLIGQRGAK